MIFVNDVCKVSSTPISGIKHVIVNRSFIYGKVWICSAIHGGTKMYLSFSEDKLIPILRKM